MGRVPLTHGPLQAVNVAGRVGKLVLTHTIGQGATCRVVKIEGDPAKVVKLLSEDEAKRQEHKVRSMLLNPPRSISINHHGTSYTELAWPQELVFENGAFRGFTMPALDGGTTFQLHNFFTSRDRADAGIRQDYFFRYHVALNLAKAVANLHEAKHYIIDFKPENVWVHRNTGFVVPLDTDGFSIADGANRYPARHYTHQYIAPEAQVTATENQQAPQRLGEAQDRFALGVVLFQLLNEGIHPYQGEPRGGQTLPSDTQASIDANLYSYGLTQNPQQKPRANSLHKHFDAKTRELFDRCFTQPNNRPSAGEWVQHLKSLHPTTGSTPLGTCSKDSTHVRFPGQRCAYCARGTIDMYSQHPAPPPPRPSRPPIPLPIINWSMVGAAFLGVLFVWWIMTQRAPGPDMPTTTAEATLDSAAEVTPTVPVPPAVQRVTVGTISRWDATWGIARVFVTAGAADTRVYCDNVEGSTTQLELLPPKEGAEVIAARIVDGAECAVDAPLRNVP